MHFIIMSYLVSDTNRTPKVQLHVAVRIVYYDSDDINSSTYYSYYYLLLTIVGPVYVSFVSNPWARILLTKDTRTLLNRKLYSFFINQIYHSI